MDGPRTTIDAALRSALDTQAKDPDSGYGVSFQVGAADCFVQWVRSFHAPASLDALEVKSEGAEPPADSLSARGMTPHSSVDLAEIGIWECTDPASMSWPDEGQLIAALAELARLLGGRDQQLFTVYP